MVTLLKGGKVLCCFAMAVVLLVAIFTAWVVSHINKVRSGAVIR
jgi:hypothetical protein